MENGQRRRTDIIVIARLLKQPHTANSLEWRGGDKHASLQPKRRKKQREERNKDPVWCNDRRESKRALREGTDNRK